MKLVSLALSALPLSQGGGAPTEFRILSAGLNKTEQGDFLFDERAAELVMEAYRSKGLGKIQIDYEHQSLQAPPGGGDAAKPAAGWFKPEVRGGELWATEIAWTARARLMLAPTDGAPEYRFYSPVLGFNEETRRVVRLKNLALTNDPAMDGIGPLAAATARKEDQMETCAACATLTAKLKVKEEECTSLTARLSAYEDKDKDKSAAMTALTAVKDRVVALTGQATEAGALGAIEAWKKDAAEVVSLRAERAKEQETALTAQMKDVLDAAEKAGKLPPAMRALEEKGALAFGAGKVSKDGVEYLTAKFGAAPVVVKPNGTGDPTEKQTGTAVLTSDDREIARLMGNDPKGVLDFKTKQIEERAKAALGVL